MSTPTPDHGEPWGVDELKKPWNAKMPCGHSRQYGTLGEYAPVRCLACENVNLNKELAELREWKRQQLEVERQWDCQKVGKLLGVPLGAHVRPHIEPKIAELMRERDKAREENARLREAIKDAAYHLRYVASEADAGWDARNEARQALVQLQPFLTP